MAKSKCEEMSKAQKAAEKHARKEWSPNWTNEREQSERDFMKGAEALLRYAKRKKVNHDCQGTCRYFGVDMVRFSDLEEWVNGAKQGGKS